MVGDRNGDGVGDLALFGFNESDNKPRLFIRDGLNAGIAISNYTWPANWKDVELLQLDDLNNDGVGELAIMGFHVDHGRPNIIVKDGATPTNNLPNVSWPNIWDNVSIHRVSDATNDGVDDVAIFGQRSASGINQFFIKDGVSRGKVTIYNWGNNWNAQNILLLDDISSDGVGDLAITGVRKDDGRAQMILRGGDSKTTRLGNIGWPGVLQASGFMQVKDRDGDGLADVAAWGVRSDNQRFQIVAKSTSSKLSVKTNGWPALWDTVTILDLDDHSGDGEPDFALLGDSKATGMAELSVIDSATNKPLSIYQWETSVSQSSLMELDDINGDGIKELGMFSSVNGQGTLVIKDGLDPTVTLKTMSQDALWY